MTRAARPRWLVCVVGTGTNVGKTWVSAHTLALLRAGGHRVAVRKPVQSFDPDSVEPTDADILAAATGEHPHVVCPAHRWYPLAMAPPMAASECGLASFTVDDLVSETRWPQAVDVGLVETAGGPRSPIASDGDSADLCFRIDPDVIVLVADAGLGAINAVRLCVAPFIDRGVGTAIVLNRYRAADRLHSMNRDWLTERLGIPVTTGPSELATYLRPDTSQGDERAQASAIPRPRPTRL